MSKPENPEAPLLPFRVHFEDGESLITHAPDATTARAQAGKQRAGIIRKVKRDRSGEHG
ncbi:hypothetical protein [Rhizobium sp. AAP43]|uniref:hypothetical protein n=1 Tax=Rhizobium sp. AAP43 TaxID=1523420 RepID=UPI000AB76A98|nr:hypothetical protein [Rhizobium sp. AAP43]